MVRFLIAQIIAQIRETHLKSPYSSHLCLSKTTKPSKISEGDFLTFS